MVLILLLGSTPVQLVQIMHCLYLIELVVVAGWILSKNMSDLINIECIQCPLPDNEGRVPFICDKIGVNLYNLQMSPGFWRWYNHSHFYWCPVKETCPGGNLLV